MDIISKGHKLNFSFLDVSGGDAIWVRFLGDDQNWHNILIDGGYGQQYKNGFGPLIQSLSETEDIDLWVISHIDLDHIGAVLGYMRDRKIHDKKPAVRKFWFNSSPLFVSEGAGKLGVGQGVKFRELLLREGLEGEGGITTEMGQKDFWGLKITILSPTPAKAAVADALWQDIERTGKLGKKAEHSDYMIKIEKLRNGVFNEDSNPWNGSSIALLLDFHGIQTLLLGDSHPTVISGSLRRLGVTTKVPLKPAFVQLGHHGSKANTSTELLELIDTDTFLVTGNGTRNCHPDKETLVRVLTRHGRPQREIQFVFPCSTPALRQIFAVDSDPNNLYNFRCTFPENGNRHVSLNFLPLTEDLQ